MQQDAVMTLGIEALQGRPRNNKLRQLLWYLVQEYRRSGLVPTQEQLRHYLQTASRRQVTELLRNLQQLGFIRLQGHRVVLRHVRIHLQPLATWQGRIWEELLEQEEKP